ncbi:MAG: hypothetical protein LBS76_02215 [Mycoplasmataceae bacterium]|nr:hypothetical protein [Mycoplasmataceae bacterium]
MERENGQRSGGFRNDGHELASIFDQYFKDGITTSLQLDVESGTTLNVEIRGGVQQNILRGVAIACCDRFTFAIQNCIDNIAAGRMSEEQGMTPYIQVMLNTIAGVHEFALLSYEKTKLLVDALDQSGPIAAEGRRALMCMKAIDDLTLCYANATEEQRHLYRQDCILQKKNKEQLEKWCDDSFPDYSIWFRNKFVRLELQKHELYARITKESTAEQIEGVKQEFLAVELQVLKHPFSRQRIFNFATFARNHGNLTSEAGWLDKRSINSTLDKTFKEIDGQYSSLEKDQTRLQKYRLKKKTQKRIHFDLKSLVGDKIVMLEKNEL